MHRQSAYWHPIATGSIIHIGTDINRRLCDLLAGSGCAVVADRPGTLGGVYRAIVVRMDAAGDDSSDYPQA